MKPLLLITLAIITGWLLASATPEVKPKVDFNPEGLTISQLIKTHLDPAQKPIRNKAFMQVLHIQNKGVSYHPEVLWLFLNENDEEITLGLEIVYATKVRPLEVEPLVMRVFEKHKDINLRKLALETIRYRQMNTHATLKALQRAFEFDGDPEFMKEAKGVFLEVVPIEHLGVRKVR